MCIRERQGWIKMEPKREMERKMDKPLLWSTEEVKVNIITLFGLMCECIIHKPKDQRSERLARFSQSQFLWTWHILRDRAFIRPKDGEDAFTGSLLTQHTQMEELLVYKKEGSHTHKPLRSEAYLLPQCFTAVIMASRKKNIIKRTLKGPCSTLLYQFLLVTFPCTILHTVFDPRGKKILFSMIWLLKF